jgi:hypothetical protein
MSIILNLNYMSMHLPKCLASEILQIVTQYVEQMRLASDHWCYAPNQLQCLLLIRGGHSAVSVVERLNIFAKEIRCWALQCCLGF